MHWAVLLVLLGAFGLKLLGFLFFFSQMHQQRLKRDEYYFCALWNVSGEYYNFFCSSGIFL